MECPKCRKLENEVVDSRYLDDVKMVRRRRRCLKCEHRWTTHEMAGMPVRQLRRMHTLMRRWFEAEKFMHGISDELVVYLNAFAAGEEEPDAQRK